MKYISTISICIYFSLNLFSQNIIYEIYQPASSSSNWKKLSKKNKTSLKKIVKDFNNKKNLANNIIEIRNNLTRRSHIA